MRTPELIAADEARLAKCAELERLLDIATRRHHARSAEELAAWLPGEEGDRLRMLLDEAREWSRPR